MAIRLSIGLRNAMCATVPRVTTGGATRAATGAIAAVTGTPDSFTDSGNGFVTGGFKVGDTIMVSGFATAVNNGIFTISSVAAGTIEIVETTVVNESAGSLNVKIQSISGGSIKDIFKDGVIDVYTGIQPTTANDAIGTVTKLLSFSVDHLTFAHGSPANGLRFGTATTGVLTKADDDWQALGLADGTAAWFRFKANVADADTGSNTTNARIDGTVRTSGGDMTISSVAVVTGATITCDSFTITMPAA
jgi:hypothetical protein